MKPCLSQTLTMPHSFQQDVENFAKAGCYAMEVWLTKLETHLNDHSIEDTKQLLNDNNIELSVAAYQGGLLLSQGEAKQQYLEQFQQRLDLCRSFGIDTLLIIADYVEKADISMLQTALSSLKHAAQIAAKYDVQLALEFRNNAKWCSCLATAIALVSACHEANVGINLDLFHFYTGPSKSEDIAQLNRENLAHVQLCDLAGIPREFATDSDRIFPDEGDFHLQPIIDHLKDIQYEGWISVEVMNPDLWQMNPVQVIESAITCLRKLLGQAEMGAGMSHHS